MNSTNPRSGWRACYDELDWEYWVSATDRQPLRGFTRIAAPFAHRFADSPVALCRHPLGDSTAKGLDVSGDFGETLVSREGQRSRCRAGYRRGKLSSAENTAVWTCFLRPPNVIGCFLLL